PEAEGPRVGADEVAAAVATPATAVDASALPQAASKSFVPTKEPEDVTGKLTQDLSTYQWGFSNVAGGLPVHPNRTPGFDIGLADWNKDKAALNSNPDQVVAVIDMGIDYNHPDLKNVMKDLSKDPHAAEYAKLGFGPFGANLMATSPDSATSKTDPMDEQYHGTHVAGIVAAEWNDVGTSGIANGTKLIGMKIGGQRSLSIDAAINAYEMLAQAMDVGLNLVATNNSWGAPSSSAKILSIAVAKLGERGAVSVFASGNNTANTSISPFTVNGLMHNPYVVSVNASMFAGKRAALSNYGVESTDVYAPGDSILSTVPLKAATDRYSFLPQPGDAVRESFNTPGSEKARCYGSDTFNNLQNPVGSHSADFSSDAGGSWTVNRSMMKEGEDGSFKLVFKMEVDAAKLVDARMVGLDISVSTPSGSGFPLFAVPFMEAANGETISDQTQMQMVTYGDNWGRFTFDLKKLLEAGNAEGLKYYEEGGKTYVNIGLSLDPNGAPVPAFDAHLDNISMGYESIGYYTTSGTSMASPVVAGAAAIFADRLKLDNSDRAQAAQNARLLAATLKGSVKTSDEFVGYCTSGGQISLDPTVKKTPVINEASVENAGGSDLIALSGYFFGADAGAGGAVLVGGKSAEVVSWSDNVVKVRCPKEINKGIHEVMVTNADNKTGRKTFNLALSTESPDAVPMLEETIVLPEKLASVARSAKMIGLGGKLYLMPDYAATSMGDSLKPYYGDLWRYDPQSKQWAELANLPERLDTLSMTLYEGKLLVLGRTSLDNQETRLFSFDPATDAWSKLDGIQAIPKGAALTNVEGSLMLVGGSTEQGDIALFDLASRTVTPVGSLKTGRLLGNPLASSDISIAVSGSDLFVAGGSRPSGAPIGTKLERLSRTEQGYTASDIGGSLPKLAPEYPSAVGLAAPKAGIVAAGVKAAADGSPSSLAQTDLYLLDSAKPDSSFTSMGKRSSYGALEMPCALAYDGKLYVAGTDKHADPT
ncbi:MAG: S8 family serine peptidase, partial [Clostridia bacterium]